MQIKPVVGRLAYLLPDKSNRLVLQARTGAHLPQAHTPPVLGSRATQHPRLTHARGWRCCAPKRRHGLDMFLTFP